jgi:hypothetical protein
MNEKRDPQGIQVKAAESELFGRYSTLAQITHTPEEFTVRFLYVAPDNMVGQLQASIITSPAHAKRFHRALGENIRRYEEKFGEIREHQGNPEPPLDFVQ